MIEVRNAVWADNDHTAINLEIKHDVYGWIPFGAIPDDVMDYGREIYRAGAAGEYPVAEYQEPDKGVTV